MDFTSSWISPVFALASIGFLSIITLQCVKDHKKIKKGQKMLKALLKATETTTPEPKRGPVSQRVSSDKKLMKI